MHCAGRQQAVLMKQDDTMKCLCVVCVLAVPRPFHSTQCQAECSLKTVTEAAEKELKADQHKQTAATDVTATETLAVM